MTHSPVLIIGAGPTGLVLALWLTKIGIKVRIIDKTDRPGTTSRALAIHARTLEFYRQLGLSDAVVEKGFKFPAANLWANKKHKARIDFSGNGKGLTPFAYVIIFPQDQHEEFLLGELKKIGVEVERQTELISFEQNHNKVTARIKLSSGAIEDCTADYMVGCDGARSTVRKSLDTGFEGSTYPGRFFVADIVGEGPVINGELNLSLNKAEFLAIFPMKDKGHARLIGQIKDIDNNETYEWKDIKPRVDSELDINIKEVRWFSTYAIHHRVASHFQNGRVFLAGDAGHIHSPVGGQGMNTGIGDAVNLAWKLGDVLKGKADLLSTYEPERIAFAQTLVASTDNAFQLVTSPTGLARFVRLYIFPNLAQFATKFNFVKRLMFRTVAQTSITYRHQVKSGDTGEVRSGDRLPWIESVDNYAPLKSLAWQIHIYGFRPEISSATKSNVEVYRFNWNQEMKEKNLKKDAIYLIRPDGYIAKITL